MKEKKVRFVQMVRGLVQFLFTPVAPILKNTEQFEDEGKPLYRYETILFYNTLLFTSIAYLLFKVNSIFMPNQHLLLFNFFYIAAWIIVILSLFTLTFKILIPPRISVHRLGFIFVILIQVLILISL